MSIDHAGLFEGRRVCAASSMAMLLLAGMLLTASDGLAQSAPPFVVTTNTTLVYTPSAVKANPPSGLQGTFGTLAVDKLGDLFLGGYNLNQAIEFPANGGTPVVLYTSSSNHVGPVTVDPYGNVIVTDRYASIITMLPYANGTWATFVDTGSSYSTSAPPVPPVCTGTVSGGVVTLTSTSACTYDFPLYYYPPGVIPIGGGKPTNVITGGYYQPVALAFDPEGNSYMATAADSAGGFNIFECDEQCNYNGGPPKQLLHFINPPVQPPPGSIYTPGDFAYIACIAVDVAGDVFFTNMTGELFEVPAGQTTFVSFSTAFVSAQGLAFDQNGNLYVSDNGTGSAQGYLYEIPLENGTLNPADMFPIYALNTPSYSGANNQNLFGVAIDQHGNIFQQSGYSTLLKYTVGNANLPATALGKTSAAVTMTLTFGHATTLKSSSITSSGAVSTEFAVDTTAKGACATGTPYKAGDTCTINATFTPRLPGLRTATLTLTDTTGDAVPVVLSGTGTGQGITVDPGTLTSIGSNLKSPEAVTVDASGNVFIADAGANKVYEYAQGTGPGVAIGSGLKQPGGVATDAAGNLYISDTGNYRVVEILNNNGVLDPSTQTTLVSGLILPGQLAVDSNGTLYVPEIGNADVVSFVERDFGFPGFMTTPVTNLNGPTAVAVDAAGNLYIADSGNNRVVEFSDGNVSGEVAGLNNPTGVALDASGSALIADSGNGRIVRVPSISGVLSQSEQTTVTISSAIQSPYAVGVDAVGNLYATDKANHAAYAVNRTLASIAFGRVNGGSSSVEETAVLASAGTAGLSLETPLYPPLPSGSPFVVTPGATGGCAGGATLVAGSSCALDTQFSPNKTVSGLQNASLNFSTGAQNTSSASLQLSGTAVNLTFASVALAQTAPAGGNVHYGSPVTVSATITSKTGTGPTPTGTVVFIVDGAGGRPQPLNSTASASLVLSGLSGGTHAIAAQYSGDSHYAPQASSVLNIVILPDASLTAMAINACVTNPLSAAPSNPTNTCDSVTMEATVVPTVAGTPTGSVVFSSGGTTLGSATLVSSSKGSVTTYTAILTTTSIPEGTYNVVATYTGNADYQPSTSKSTQLIITPPKFTLTANTLNLTASASSSSSSTITITSYSNFQGAVNFACTGLPANAYCRFLPAVVSLIPTTTGPANVPALTTTLEVQADQPPVVTPTGIFWWGGLLLGLSLLGLARNRRTIRRLWMMAAAGCVLLVFAAGLTGCGSSTSFNTPSGTSTVVVTATATPVPPSGANPNPANNVTATLTFNLTVK